MIDFEAELIETRVIVDLGVGENGFPAILSVSLETKAKVPGISKERFEYCAERARTHCTIAVLIKLEIQMTATLLP